MSTRTVFFALWPDNRQRDHLRDVINSVARGVEGKAVDRRNWHITLAYAGPVEGRLIPQLQQAASRVQVEPFRLSFDRLDYWARPKVACLIAPTIPTELQTLVDALQSVLLDIGVTTENRTYRPHITVSRGARAFTTERLAQRTITEWNSFELMESITAPGSLSYVPLKQ